MCPEHIKQKKKQGAEDYVIYSPICEKWIIHTLSFHLLKDTAIFY